MKLISFAVVSLLAITVSAYPPQTTTTNDVQSSQSTSTQDMQPSQSTSTDDMQQPYQDRVQAEMGRLTAVCKEKEDFLIQADSDSQTGHYQVLQFEDMVGKLHDELKKIDISSDEESELKQKYHDARMKLDESDDILRGIDLSLAKYDRIETDKKTYGARLFSAQSDELSDVIQILQSQSRAAEKIFAAAQIDSVDR
ncbi:hypothetical protein BASA62_003036 [Batrachochytrium salamandrivorans]|nr:hypothetical protein BASA62_003036 [Batrachochytrium salamandrivorans]